MADETVSGLYCNRPFPIKLTHDKDPVPKDWKLRRDVILYDVPEQPLKINGPYYCRIGYRFGVNLKGLLV